MAGDFLLLLISQQNMLNKICSECVFYAFVNLVFCKPKIFRPIREKTVFVILFAKAYSSYNMHVRHFAFGQCNAYIISYYRSLHFWPV